MSDFFEKLVQVNFKFLETEFDAHIAASSIYLVKYQSSKFELSVSNEKWEIFVTLSKPKSVDRIFLGSILKFKGLEVDCRPPFIGKSDGEKELHELASLVRHYCIDFLQGDFSCFEEIKQYEKIEGEKWWQEQYKKYGKKSTGL